MSKIEVTLKDKVHRFRPTPELLMYLTAAQSLGIGLTVTLHIEPVMLEAHEVDDVLRPVLKALTGQDKPDRTVIDHGLFDAPDVHNVTLPEALKKYAEPGETPEQTKARLSELWFDLNQRFIALSRGEIWPEPLTHGEHRLMNEISIFARG